MKFKLVILLGALASIAIAIVAGWRITQGMPNQRSSLDTTETLRGEGFIPPLVSLGPPQCWPILVLSSESEVSQARPAETPSQTAHMNERVSYP